MKAWHIAALLLGVVVVMTILKSQKAKAASTGASSNDVILGLSKFGSGLLDLGGKIFPPSASTNSGLGASVWGSPASHEQETIPSWGDSSNTG